MAGNEAKVKFTGDATGAAAAADKASQGLKNVGGAAKQMGQDATKAADDAAKAELRYEQEVQKSIQKLKQKEQATKANTEAMKRLGMAEKEANSTRGAVAGLGNAGGGGVGAGRLVQGMGRIGGAAGGALSGIGAGLAAASGPLIAVAVAAAGLKIGFEALLAVGQKRAEQEARIVALENERADAIKAGTTELGNNAIAAAQALGIEGKRALARGTSIQSIDGVAGRTGLAPSQAAEVSGLLVGLSDELRKKIEQAVKDSTMLGGDGVEAARTLSAEARSDGNFGTQSRGDLARRGLGGFGDSLSDQQITAGLRNSDLANIQAVDQAGTRGTRAGISLINNQGAIIAAQDNGVAAAKKMSDPVGVALKEISDRNGRAVELLERQAAATGLMVALLQDISAKLKGGPGSYAAQAAEVRAAMAAAGGG